MWWEVWCSIGYWCQRWNGSGSEGILPRFGSELKRYTLLPYPAWYYNGSSGLSSKPGSPVCSLRVQRQAGPSAVGSRSSVTLQLMSLWKKRCMLARHYFIPSKLPNTTLLPVTTALCHGSLWHDTVFVRLLVVNKYDGGNTVVTLGILQWILFFF